MNDAGAFAARRAALRRAFLTGDAFATARAAARLRLPGAPPDPNDLLVAGRARHAVGVALLRARHPRTPPPPRLALAPAPPAARRRGLRGPIVIAAAALLLIWYLLPAGLPWEDGGGGEPAQPPNSAASVITGPLRGRTVALAPVVVAASPTPEPTPEPTAAATEAPSAAPTATARPGSPRPGGSGRPGPTGSGGSGSGGLGGGGGLPTPTPTLRPAPTSRIPMEGFARIEVTVLDARTLRPVQGACVLLRDTVCLPWKPQTDGRGVWSDQIPVITSIVFWEVYVIKDGYQQAERDVVLRSRSIVRLFVLLRPSG